MPGSADKSIILWSVDGVLIRRVCGHSRGIHSLLCGPKWLVSASSGTLSKPRTIHSKRRAVVHRVRRVPNVAGKG